jgi:hypothetical protein
MGWRLARIPERLAIRAGESRRDFLGKFGRHALTAATALSGLLVSGSSGRASSDRSGTVGACYWTSSGTQTCEQLTQTQCAAITGSNWTPGPCTFAMPEL